MSVLPGLSGAVVAGVAPPMSFSGSFSASAASSTVTSTTRTATVPAGNSGTLIISVLTSSAADQQYSKNGGAWVSFGVLDSIILANGDTLAFRATGCGSSGAGISTMTIKDFDNNSTVQAGISIVRS